jgi:uncharacterized membrane protein
MDALRISLVLSTLLCALVAGFVFAFASVAMPGIRSLSDHDFLQAFKAMDRVIQNNQPLFMLVWAGSVVALVASAVLGISRLDGADRLLIVSATAIYLLGVQLPTATINIPLNNRLQADDLGTLTESELHDLRSDFEPRWTRWNSIRTVFAVLSSTLLIILLLRFPCLQP